MFVDPALHAADLDAHLEALQRELAASPEGGPAGDPTLLPRRLESAPASELARTFGDAFAQAVAQQATGVWSAPIESAFGRHIVRVLAREEGRDPSFDDVRAAVQRDWSYARTRIGRDAFYRALRDRYRVTIERPAGGQADGVPSGELVR